MAHKVLHLFLAAVIAACPIWCSVGVCVSADGCEAEECHALECCCSCECEHEGCNEDRCDDEPSQPCDDSGCGICQCVCGGAILEQCSCEVTDHGMMIWLATHDSSAHELQGQFSPAATTHAGRAGPGCRLWILHLAMLL